MQAVEDGLTPAVAAGAAARETPIPEFPGALAPAAADEPVEGSQRGTPMALT